MKKVTALLAAGITVLSLANFAAARSGMGAMGHEGGFGMLEVMADQIGITEEQESDINAIVNAAQLASAVDRERVGQIREELRNVSQSGEVFDASTAEALASELGELVSRTAAAAAETRWQVRQVLSSEQLAEIDAIKAERMGMRFRMGPGADF